MKNSSKLDEPRKSKDDQQIAVISSLEQIRRVTDTNQLRLRHLELAIVNLTSICNAIRNDMDPLDPYPTSDQGSSRKLQGDFGGMKRRSSSLRSSLELKGDVLGSQMQQLVEQAATSGLFNKDSKARNMKANSKIPTTPASKKVQATTTNHKTSTKSSLVKSSKSTTEKKISMNQVENRIGASQPRAKAPPEKGSASDNSTKASARVPLKSSVKIPKTTASNIAISPSTRTKSKETKAKKVEKIQSKGTIKVTIKANQAHNKSCTAEKSFASTRMNLLSTSVPKCDDLKPRRKWSFAEDITLKK